MMVIAAYDIVDDSTRSAVAALLQVNGDRVQKSVFVLQLEAEALGALRDRILARIDPNRDSVYFWRQCHSCHEVVQCLGQASVARPTLYWAV